MRKATVIIDLLRTTPSLVCFSERVLELELSSGLEKKILESQSPLANYNRSSARPYPALSRQDEKELATEMLLYRHTFTELTFQTRDFRQAALTVIQNIYLFSNRKIFFNSTASSSEKERQEALLIFSQPSSRATLPLVNTFQHLIIARVWNRILTTTRQTPETKNDKFFRELHSVVERLNTLRNIYMLLTSGLVRKLVKNINAIYKESITYEDAVQIGSFGIARAAYRYHQSCGVRFTTYASNWVFKEIQRQALQGRLIKISSNTVEKYSRAAKERNREKLQKFATELTCRTALQSSCEVLPPRKDILSSRSLSENLEAKELQRDLLQAIDQNLSAKSGDVIKRRYGLPPYGGQEQSVIDISALYGVTRGSIYQLEQTALKKLALSLVPYS